MNETLSYIKDYIENGKTFRIAFVGDSITSCEWVHPNWREIVEYVLKEELQKVIADWTIPSWNIRCLNCAFNGATTKDIVDRLERDILSYQPIMILCIIGTNDLHAHISPEEQVEHVRSIIDRSLTICPHFVFATSPADLHLPTQEYYPEYVDALKRFFPYKNVRFVNLYEEYRRFDLKRFFTFVSSGNEVAGIKPGEIDTMHPNQLGNAYIAKVFLEQIFDISFDPERYIRETLEGKMYPGY